MDGHLRHFVSLNIDLSLCKGLESLPELLLFRVQLLLTILEVPFTLEPTELASWFQRCVSVNGRLFLFCPLRSCPTSSTYTTSHTSHSEGGTEGTSSILLIVIFMYSSLWYQCQPKHQLDTICFSEHIHFTETSLSSESEY